MNTYLAVKDNKLQTKCMNNMRENIVQFGLNFHTYNCFRIYRI